MANFCLEIRFFLNFLKKRNFLVKLSEKVEIFRKFAWKMEILLTRIHAPQISNQIDAADITYIVQDY